MGGGRIEMHETLTIPDYGVLHSSHYSDLHISEALRACVLTLKPYVFRPPRVRMF